MHPGASEGLGEPGPPPAPGGAVARVGPAEPEPTVRAGCQFLGAGEWARVTAATLRRLEIYIYICIYIYMYIYIYVYIFGCMYIYIYSWVWVKIKPPGIGPQVLVHVSIFEGSIWGTHSHFAFLKENKMDGIVLKGLVVTTQGN